MRAHAPCRRLRVGVSVGGLVGAIVGASVLVAGCPSASPVKPSPTPQPIARPLKPDPHSVAVPAKVAVTGLALDLTVDFDQRVLHGTARLAIDRRDLTADLLLDTDSLDIRAVIDCSTKQPLRWTRTPAAPVLGHALAITPISTCVEIDYRTAPDAAALLWVEPAGTSGKQQPMLFTQSQAIHARSWIPLQDTPGVRFTYQATIRVANGLRAVMSAENPQPPPADGVWRFTMAQPVPSYLVALAVGDLAFRPIGPRTGVYAEPSIVAAAAHEFAEVEAMMASAEKLYGPYRWGRYDMLVLPPSFPLGGMENPRLTFLTPTVITGDRALVSLIAHELAHSWSGNLVTNSTWSDLWLNEGFTTYVERRIMEELRGRDQVDVLWYLGRKDLDEAFARPETNPQDTRLALDSSAERGAEDIPSDAAYEKGALFLRTLEQAFGRPLFDDFLRRRFDRLAFQSTDTVAFELDAKAELLAKRPAAMTERVFASWIHEPLLPAGVPPAASPRVSELEATASAYARRGVGFAPTGWQTLDWVIFLRALPADVTRARLLELDRDFSLTASTNAEISTYWLPLVIRADIREASPVIQAFLLRVGRRRMVTPIYEAMARKGEPWRALAKQTFEQARRMYHPVTRDRVAKIVGG